MAVKKMLIIVCSVLVVLTIVYFIIGNVFYNIALNPSASKDDVFDNQDVSGAEFKSNVDMASLRQWLLDTGHIVSVESYDGLLLKGRQVITGSDTWVIVVHGYMQNGFGMVEPAKKFYDKGYNILVPDLRGHGISEGRYVGMGWHDRLDIVKWINNINEAYPNVKIVLYGVSMGAATVMMTLGEDLPDNVICAIEDSGYTDVWNVFTYQLGKIYKLPKFPVLYAADTITAIRAGYSLKEGSAVEQLKKSKTPTLFIHGDIDTFVPFSMLEIVYNAANTDKDMLVVQGAGHVESYKVEPEKYWSTVFGFIDKYDDYK